MRITDHVNRIFGSYLPWKTNTYRSRNYLYNFSEFHFFFWKMKIFKSPQLFFREFPGQTVFCITCGKSWIFQKWRFRRVGLRWAIKNHPFLLKKWFSMKIYGFSKTFFRSNWRVFDFKYIRIVKIKVLEWEMEFRKSHQILPTYAILKCRLRAD